MSYERREFLKLAAGSAGTLLLTGCGSGSADDGTGNPPGQVSEPPPVPAQPDPSAPQPDPAPTPEPDPGPQPDPDPEPQPDPQPEPQPDPEPDPEPGPPPDPHITALQNYLRTHAVPGLSLPAMATELPTISWAGALRPLGPAATTLPSGTIYPASHPLIRKVLPERFAPLVGVAPVEPGLPGLSVRRPYSCRGVPRSVESAQVFRLRTNAPVLELTGMIADGTLTVQTLIVDGRLVPPKVLSSSRGAGGWSAATIRVDFGSRRLRDIWIQTALNLAFIRVGQPDLLLPVDDSGDPQITAIGDSFQQARSSTFGNIGALALSLGSRLGLRKIATDGHGGTGYWNTGNSIGNLNDRLPAHSADGSAVYLVMAGLNDYGDSISPGTLAWPTRAQYEQAVLGYLQGLRAAQPNALIVVTAPFCPNANMSDATYAAYPGTNSSGLGDFLYKAQVFRQSIQQIAAPWVYIDVLMGGGWLNSSGATGDVTGLQWLTGGTPAPGTSATYKPGNTNGGGGGGFGGIAHVPVISPGQYSQAPEVLVSGGSGFGLLLWSRIDSAGNLTGIHIVSPGEGYTDGAGLPTITLDPTFAQSPAVLGPPTLFTGINPDGMYPLPSFAPPGVTAAELNNIYVMNSIDRTHPSPVGVEYFARRLARNIYDAVMALQPVST